MLKKALYIGIVCLSIILNTSWQVTGLISWAEISYESVVNRFQHDDYNLRCKKEICNSNKTTDCKKPCDENVLILQLSKLYVLSPERVIMLLTNQMDMCNHIEHVISHIKLEFAECIPLDNDNIYVRLKNSIEFFYDNVCNYQSSFLKHLSCFHQLRDDYMECEGSPDWYEHHDPKVVCNDAVFIIDCIYMKTAMLCGLKSACDVRDLSESVFKTFIQTECKLSKKLPKVIAPMPDRCQCHLISTLSKLYLIILIIIIIKVYV